MSQIECVTRAGRMAIGCVLALGCAVAITQTARAAALIYGYDHTNKHLVSFFSDAPGDLVGDVALTGLVASEFLAGLDFRPATGELYSVAIDGSTVRVVTIDTATGAVTQVGAPAVAPFGSPYGLDFDPVADSLSFVGDSGEIYGIDPDTGVGVLLVGLQYTGAESPMVAHIAYTNSTASATTTVLYGIDWSLGVLVVSGVLPPNDGLLTTVGFVGLGTLGAGGFDIEPGTNAAYAALRAGSVSSLYSVDLATGAATQVGTIGDGTIAGIAIAPEPSAFASALCAAALLGCLQRRKLC